MNALAALAPLALAIGAAIALAPVPAQFVRAWRALNRKA